jgi:hypothetical protein
VNPEEEQIIEVRLKNWGIFNRFGNSIGLGVTSYSQLMSAFIAQDCYISPDINDAMEIGGVISTLDIAARRGDINWGDVYAYVLDQEYRWFDRAYDVKAEKVRDKFGFPCSEKTFKKHVRVAKITVFFMAQPLSKAFTGQYSVL